MKKALLLGKRERLYDTLQLCALASSAQRKQRARAGKQQQPRGEGCGVAGLRDVGRGERRGDRHAGVVGVQLVPDDDEGGETVLNGESERKAAIVDDIILRIDNIVSIESVIGRIKFDITTMKGGINFLPFGSVVLKCRNP